MTASFLVREGLTFVRHASSCRTSQSNLGGIRLTAVVRDAISQTGTAPTKPLPRYLRKREPKAQRAAILAWARKYFRKAVLACGEREWRHVEYEYPAEARKTFQARVGRMSRAFDLAFTQFCDETVGRQN